MTKTCTLRVLITWDVRKSSASYNIWCWRRSILDLILSKCDWRCNCECLYWTQGHVGVIQQWLETWSHKRFVFPKTSLLDPNPLIRESALRVLTCIRIPVIAPLILCATKEPSHDLSPYVMKTPAFFVPKLLSLDKNENKLVSFIEVFFDG